MLSAISGVVTLLYLATSGWIGIRLIRKPSTDDGDRRISSERLLGLFFVLYSCVAAGLNVAIYAGWADARLAMPVDLERLFHGGFFVIGGAGIFCLLVFTRRLFRPADTWGGGLMWGLTGVLALAATWTGVSEGFRVLVLNGPGYWIQFAARDCVFVWLCAESTLYWRRLRLRMRLGLAEPLLVNRFLLIAIWGASLAILAWVDPVARVWYWRATGSTAIWIPEVGAPMLALCTAVSTGFLSISMVALLLAFFPTRGYRRFIERRARGLAGSE